MNEFDLKGSITDEDFMIYILNNLPKEYDGIHTDDLQKLNHAYNKLKTKQKKKKKKEALGTYNKQFKKGAISMVWSQTCLLQMSGEQWKR